MSRVSRKEDAFFSLFSEFASLTVSAAKLFVDLVDNYPASQDLVPKIKDYENLCDEQVGKIITTLNSSFITPFDREDISELALLMDEIVDGMESTSARFALYDITTIRPEATQMAHLLLFATEELQKAFDRFSDCKKDESVIKHTKATNEYEDKADVVYRTAMGDIFRDTEHPVEVIKWKSLMDKMEETMDACKHVANAVQNVIVKNG